MASVLLIVSTFGPFSLVEAGVILTALGRAGAAARAAPTGRRFHLPFGDGTVIMAAAGWAALLIVTRLFDRPVRPERAGAGLRRAAGRGGPARAERSGRRDDVPRPAPAAGPGGG